MIQKHLLHIKIYVTPPTLCFGVSNPRTNAEKDDNTNDRDSDQLN